MVSRLPLLLYRAVPLLRLQARSVSTSGYHFNELPLTFSSPYESFYKKQNISQVDVSTLSGDMGILPDHVPVIAALSPGLVSVYEENGDINKFFVSSGVVTVNEDSSVQILAEEAAPLTHLDRLEAQKGLDKCQQDLNSASSEEDRATANIGIDFYEAALKAL
ncbi:ATP synthase subunit delta, mitochondrial-like [Oopsacas minuta]|uniref:F-ATPase delta subunit n=1 Tax=Oopsacas minuta TaxID=111878 RepID=A0AAV7JRD9_9METZ|nr:ATP synthase subunit delta, mitochondrial-like [Oopsacas minuta]